MNDLIFKQTAKDLFSGRSLVMGKFNNQGYGYMDANDWEPNEVIAVYELPSLDTVRT